MLIDLDIRVRVNTDLIPKGFKAYWEGCALEFIAQEWLLDEIGRQFTEDSPIYDARMIGGNWTDSGEFIKSLDSQTKV